MGRKLTNPTNILLTDQDRVKTKTLARLAGVSIGELVRVCLSLVWSDPQIQERVFTEINNNRAARYESH